MKLLHSAAFLWEPEVYMVPADADVSGAPRSPQGEHPVCALPLSATQQETQAATSHDTAAPSQFPDAVKM